MPLAKKETGEFDGLFDGLQEQPPAAPAPSAAATMPATEAPTGATPPPLARKPVASGEYKGRTRFDDLFVADTEPTSAVRAGPAEKVEYFREKLRRAEAQAARLRDAWQIREGELDAVEALLEQERRRADESARALQQLQTFIDKKKVEFDDYGQKVAQVVAERDAATRAATAEIEELRGKAKREHGEATAQAQKLEASLAERDVRMAELEIGLLRASDSSTEAVALQAEAEQTVAAHEATIDKLKAALAQRSEQVAKLKSQLGVAEEAIVEAKASAAAGIEEAGSSRDTTMAELQEKLRSVEANLTKLQGQKQNADAKCAMLEAALEQAREQGAASSRRGENPVDLAKRRKVIDLAQVLLSDLESAQIATADKSGAQEIFKRLHRALEILKRETES